MSSTVHSGAPDLDRDAIDYEKIKDPGHGNTPAAWTGVFLMLLGGTILSIGFVMGIDIITYVGLAVFVAGPIVGLIMRAAGKGKPRS
ncbi:HGxxPAAW family protein [Brevibacterium jeotgali]|uniref:Uncharacterized protein n=1 Tax=Brevibacterium jeotgali TaxID=1262550 RepID=A0A2H1L246_9MICO|nr:HGxxPAAW family protein [Brevibacterium jeotgali]TWC02930.1 hypothetical protein FB108_1634 [Brevibacterium jeotgali]SMY10952.1 hypothetical protein BJEO58_00529 [Brevibacterium jeotgali]